MAIRAELHRLIDDALGDDPRRALIATRRLRDHHLPWVEARVVALARRERWNWAQIGRLLGRSRQGLHTRYRTLAPLVPADFVDATELQERTFLRAVAQLRRRREFDCDDDVIAW